MNATARRLKRQEKLEAIRAMADDPGERPAKASKYVWHVDDYVEEYGPSDVVLLVRVSSREQSKEGNLKWQKISAKEALTKIGMNVIKCYREVGSGSNPLNERKVLKRAMKKAGWLGIPLVVPCLSRLVRHLLWKTIDTVWKPTVNQMKEIARMAKRYGIPAIISMFDPDASSERERGFLSKLSRTTQGTLRIARPRKTYVGYKKEVKDTYLGLVLTMHESGISCKRIANHITEKSGHPITKMTIFRWVSAYDSI